MPKASYKPLNAVTSRYRRMLVAREVRFLTLTDNEAPVTDTAGSSVVEAENLEMEEQREENEHHEASLESESSENDSENDFDFEDFQQGLASWAVEGVSLRKVNDLLNLLRKHPSFSYLPRDSRTLLKTPRNVISKAIGKGTYCHIGVREKLIRLQKEYPCIGDMDIINVQCNIDGLPLFRSSGSQVWPILMSIEGYPMISPFVVGIYHGHEKPSSCEEYLHDFVEEMTILRNVGLEHDGRIVPVHISCYVCDAPARAFLAQIKSHTGYSSCGKCCVEGEYTCNKVIFNEFNAPPRSNASFVLQTDENHHIGVSPLLKIPGTRMVSQFPYEYMHLICLGVVRKIMFAWMNGSLEVRLPARKVELINNKIGRIAHYIPAEFARKPRSMSELPRWKATEFRLFLLYTGSFLLKGILSQSVFKHFTSLHYAIRILASGEYFPKVNYAKTLLQYFVENFGVLYGIENLTYNVHGLLHIADDCESFGPLDRFSAFKFENKLSEIKKLVRKPNDILPQIVRRLHESFDLQAIHMNMTDLKLIREKSVKSALPYGLTSPCYNKIQWKSCLITDSPPNNCVQMIDGRIAVVKLMGTLNSKVHFVGDTFANLSSFYSLPDSSDSIGIYIGSNLCHSQLFPVIDIKCKMLMIPMESDGSYYIAEILHH